MVPISLVLVVLVAIFYLRKWNRWRRMPPGPWGWPIVGSAFSVSVRRPWDSYSKLARKFGGIMSVSMSMSAEDIIISDYDLALEFFNKPEFTPRPMHMFVLDIRDGGPEGAGIVGAQGQTWQENRRFTMRTLRDFGFGKTSMNDFIMEDFNALVAKLSQRFGQPLDVNFRLNLAILNIVWRMVGNESFDHDDPVLLKLFDSFQTSLDSRGKTSVFKLIPMRLFPKAVRWLMISSFLPFRSNIDQFLKETVKNHKATRDENFNRDFIDSYLQEMQTQSPGSVINETNLLANIRNLFAAGSETTATTLRWGLLFLIMHPQIQDRAQQELDEVVGKDRDVHLDDRGSLHYNEALIMEILRCGNIAPLSVPHSCTEDATFNGYLIPADSAIVINSVHMHRDSKYWKDPLKFDPSRFLDGKGHLRTGRIPGFVPFGIGKRQCLGESLARMELFLFLTNFLARFNLSKVPGEKLPDINSTFYSTVIQRPPDYKLIITGRR